MKHVRASDFSGAGGPCGDGYHVCHLGICSCGWQVEVACRDNTCDCVPVHTAPDLITADKIATRLLKKHITQANQQTAGQQELL